MRSMEDYTRRLPAIERDILMLHMTLRKSQTEVAKILGVSQPTVNYRYKRARERLDFMENLPKVTSDEIRQVLRSLNARPNDIEAMVLYVETNSQSEVARKMQTSQGAVRHWIHRALVTYLQNDMSEDDLHKRVRTACKMMVNKPGIFNEPQKPNHVPKNRKVTQKLSSGPRYGGVLVPGHTIDIQDGVYARIPALVIKVDPVVEVLLTLESQEITLTWPRQVSFPVPT
jgi:DNA-directed RNA polymerase specialized sigma24 family protein